MNTEDQTAAAVPHELQAFTSCPEWGIGGQFIYDPATKTRTRVGGTPPASLPADAQAKIDEGLRLEDDALATQSAAAVTTTASVDAATPAATPTASVDAAAPAAATGTIKKERNRG